MATLLLNNMLFRAVSYDDKLYFSCRTMAHAECAEKAIDVRAARDSGTRFGPFRVSSKGYDCNWDEICPFCGNPTEDGEELIFSYGGDDA